MFRLTLALLTSISLWQSSARCAGPIGQDHIDRAIERAIKYLISEQYDRGDVRGAINEGQKRQNMIAMTSLAIMAMAAVGHQPSDPTPEGKAMHQALEFVLKSSNQVQGYYYGADGSRMYGHGITTLMLAEMLGMGRRRPARQEDS